MNIDRMLSETMDALGFGYEYGTLRPILNLMNLKEGDLQLFFRKAMTQYQEKTYYLYLAIKKYGFQGAKHIFHGVLKEQIELGVMTCTEVIDIYKCHKTIMKKVIAPLADYTVHEVFQKRHHDGALTFLDVMRSILGYGELETGHCIMIVCGGTSERGDNKGIADYFTSMTIICRIPMGFKLEKEQHIDDEQPLENENDGNFWIENMILEPRIVPDGGTGNWLKWFIAAYYANHYPGIPDAMKRSMSEVNLEYDGLLSDMRYVAIKPSARGSDECIYEVVKSEPGTWVNSGEDVGPPHGEQEAYLYKSLEEAVNLALWEENSVDIIARTDCKYVSDNIVFTSGRVNREDDRIKIYQ